MNEIMIPETRVFVNGLNVKYAERDCTECGEVVRMEMIGIADDVGLRRFAFEPEWEHAFQYGTTIGNDG
jgi:hypothetical protein